MNHRVILAACSAWCSILLSLAEGDDDDITINRAKIPLAESGGSVWLPEDFLEALDVADLQISLRGSKSACKPIQVKFDRASLTKDPQKQRTILTLVADAQILPKPPGCERPFVMIDVDTKYCFHKASSGRTRCKTIKSANQFYAPSLLNGITFLSPKLLPAQLDGNIWLTENGPQGPMIFSTETDSAHQEPLMEMIRRTAGTQLNRSLEGYWAECTDYQQTADYRSLKEKGQRFWKVYDTYQNLEEVQVNEETLVAHDSPNQRLFLLNEPTENKPGEIYSIRLKNLHEDDL